MGIHRRLDTESIEKGLSYIGFSDHAPMHFDDGCAMAAEKLPEYAAESCTVLGPAPCPVPKINYHFRYRLTLRCRLNSQLRQLLGHLLQQFAKDKENRNVSAFIDVNGFE